MPTKQETITTTAKLFNQYTCMAEVPVDEFKDLTTALAITPQDDIGGPFNVLLARVTVDLTVVATTPLYTVPTGKTLLADDVMIETTVVPAGSSKETSMKIGTSGGSSNELLGSTGAVFTTGTATTLPPLNSRVRGGDAVPSTNLSTARVKRFAAGSVINCVTAGANPCTAGTLQVELWGRLI